MVVCALWNDRSSCDEDGYHSHSDDSWFRNNNRNDVSVVFTVRLPEGVRIDASTVNGGVTIDGATSTVVAHTVNGSIEARSTGGAVSAHTTNGNLTISSPMLDRDDNDYTTTNGSISLELPSSVNADIDMRTVNGRLPSHRLPRSRWKDRSARGACTRRSAAADRRSASPPSTAASGCGNFDAVGS